MSGIGISVYIVSVLSKSHLGNFAFYGPVVKSLKARYGDGRNTLDLVSNFSGGNYMDEQLEDGPE